MLTSGANWELCINHAAWCVVLIFVGRILMEVLKFYLAPPNYTGNTPDLG